MIISEYWLLATPLIMALLLLSAVFITRKVMKLDQIEASRTTTRRIIELPLKLVVEVTE